VASGLPAALLHFSVTGRASAAAAAAAAKAKVKAEAEVAVVKPSLGSHDDSNNVNDSDDGDGDGGGGGGGGGGDGDDMYDTVCSDGEDEAELDWLGVKAYEGATRYIQTLCPACSLHTLAAIVHAAIGTATAQLGPPLVDAAVADDDTMTLPLPLPDAAAELALRDPADKAAVEAAAAALAAADQTNTLSLHASPPALLLHMLKRAANARLTPHELAICNMHGRVMAITDRSLEDHLDAVRNRL
jgi:hypothetical protein